MAIARLIATIVVLAVPVAACSSNASADNHAPRTTQSFQVSGFTGVNLAGSDDVDVRVGTGFSVRAEGPAAELARMRIVREGDTLRVDRKPNTGLGWTDNRGVKVFVTMPRIVAAEIRGSGNMTVDRIEGVGFDGVVTGSGNLKIAALATTQAKLSARGSGDISAAGTVDRLAVDLTGSGDIAARGLKARGAAVSLRGSGDIDVAVVGSASVALAGSGDVDLGSQARCTINKSGSGDVRCGG